MKRAFASVGIRRSDIPEDRRVRFIEKLSYRGDHGCWEWQGSKTRQGYGRFQLGEGYGCTTAQRAAYAIFVGDLAPGLTIDHLCGNRSCVNPAHLEAVAHRVNIMRSNAITAHHARRKTCKRGHALERYVGPNHSQRYCPICKRENGREWMRRHRGSDPARYRV